ncbi:MAG: RodZ domain-containing protein [Pseudomonadota bacterium]
MTDQPKGSATGVPPLEVDAAALGVRLRWAREERNLSLADVADQTRIRQAYLECIEQGRLEDLPGAVYAAGFLRTYAALLDVPLQDGEELTPPTASRPTVANQHLDFPQLPLQTSSSRLILVVAIGLIVILLAAWGVSQRAWLGDMLELVRSQPGESSAPATGQPLASPNPDTSQITVTAITEGWLQLRDAEQSLITTRLLQPGDVYSYPYSKGLNLTVSDPQAVNLSVAGQTRTIPGTPGQIARNIPLDADS